MSAAMQRRYAGAEKTRPPAKAAADATYQT